MEVRKREKETEKEWEWDKIVREIEIKREKKSNKEGGRMRSIALRTSEQRSWALIEVLASELD